jgi:hypothetical protein
MYTDCTFVPLRVKYHETRTILRHTTAYYYYGTAHHTISHYSILRNTKACHGLLQHTTAQHIMLHLTTAYYGIIRHAMAY